MLINSSIVLVNELSSPSPFNFKLCSVCHQRCWKLQLWLCFRWVLYCFTPLCWSKAKPPAGLPAGARKVEAGWKQTVAAQNLNCTIQNCSCKHLHFEKTSQISLTSVYTVIRWFFRLIDTEVYRKSVMETTFRIYALSVKSYRVTRSVHFTWSSSIVRQWRKKKQNQREKETTTSLDSKRTNINTEKQR